MIKYINRFLLNSILLLLLLYCSLIVGWYASYSNYFFFPIVYELDDIQGNVLEFAPQNHYDKKDFVFTSSGIHLKIFNEMLRSVEHNGDGLRDISYPVKGGSKKFLTNDEVVHLQDVADLLSLLRSFVRLVLVLLACVVIAMIYGKIWPFYLSRVYLGMALFIGLFALFMNKMGFVKIFYGLHRLVFPAGHKWFFYYQDSLMSTMLKAPDSFISLGIVLGVFSLIAFSIIYWLVTLFIRSRIKG